MVKLLRRATRAALATWMALCCVVTLAASSLPRAEPSCLGLVCVESTREGNALLFQAKNELRAPITVQIHFTDLENLEAASDFPEVQLVPPGQALPIARFVPRSASDPWSYNFSWSWMIGDPRALHKMDYLYRIPFGGLEPRKVSQGNRGEFSHEGARQFALDIAMPIGTPVLAARGGVVALVNDGYSQHGAREEDLARANAISILHDDRTVATYAHLDPGSGVREGMRVEPGELIGFSGNTGFSTGPHLHFEVWKPDAVGQMQSIEIRFREPHTHASFLPRTGDWLEPGCHAEGIPCPPGEGPSVPRAGRGYAVESSEDGACHCANGAVITTRLPCRMVCPRS